MKIKIMDKKWLKKMTAGALLIAITFIGYSFVAQRDEVIAEEEKVQEYVLKKEAVKEVLSTSGTVKAETVEKLLGDVSSPVTAINVAIGDQVTPGQVLAEMNPIDVESSILNQEAVIALLKQEMKALSVDKGTAKTLAYENAQVSLNNAKTSYESNQILYENGAISKTDLEKSLETYNTAKSNYEKAKSSYDAYDYATEYSILEMKLQVEATKLESLKQDLLDHQIVAAIQGIVTAINIEEGEVPKESAVMMEIQDLSNLKIEAAISEYEINDIKLGQNVSITTLGNEEKVYEGIVEEIYPSGEVEGTEVFVTVIVDVLNEDAQLKPNFSANLDIVTKSSESAFMVPYDALIKMRDGYGVKVESEGEEDGKRIIVDTGIESDLTVEIISEELEEGMVILVESEINISENKNRQGGNGLAIPGTNGQNKRMSGGMRH